MNEVIDALPVDRLIGVEGGVAEICVGLDGDVLVEVHRQARPAPLAELARSLPAGASLAPGQVGEVRPGLGEFLAAATADLGPAYLLVIDYGLPAAELYSARHRQGTLLGYHRHRAVEDVLARVGAQDLTAHVDLTALAREAGALGFAAAGTTTQMRFLLALGLGERIEALDALDLSEAERARQRLALAALIRPGGMGEMFKVWIGARQVPTTLQGLADPFR